MKVPFLSLFSNSLFDNFKEYSEKTKEAIWIFQQIIENCASVKCQNTEDLYQNILNFEAEALKIKNSAIEQIRKEKITGLDKIYLAIYLDKQNEIFKSIKNALNWVLYKQNDAIPKEFSKEFLLLTDSIIEPIEELVNLAIELKKYFKSFAEKKRQSVLEIIKNINNQIESAQRAKDMALEKLFKIDALNTSDNNLNNTLYVIYVTKFIENMSFIYENISSAVNSIQLILISH